MSHQTFEHFHIYHEKEKKSKLHTLKYKQDFFFLLQMAYQSLNLKITANMSFIDLGRKGAGGQRKEGMIKNTQARRQRKAGKGD